MVWETQAASFLFPGQTPKQAASLHREGGSLLPSQSPGLRESQTDLRANLLLSPDLSQTQMSIPEKKRKKIYIIQNKARKRQTFSTM